jgi:hypothetical protein
MYLANGQEVQVVERLSHGFLVCPILTDGYEQFPGNPEIVDRLFNEPPTAKVAAEVATLTKELVEKQAELSRVIAETETAMERRTELIASLSQVSALQYVDDFIKGKITHYVFASPYSGRIEIMSIEKTKERDGWQDRFRLLTLFGRTDGRLDWELNRYTDGSGSSQFVIPARSQKEAEDAAREHLRSLIESDKCQEWDVVVSARKLGFEPPTEYVEAARQNRLKRIQETVDYRKKELEKAEAELAVAMQNSPVYSGE